MLTVKGFDSSSNELILLLTIEDSVVIQRDYHACIRLHKDSQQSYFAQSTSQQPSIFPKDHLKKLTSHSSSWERGGEGWQPQWTKAVTTVEAWFNATIVGLTETDEGQCVLEEFVNDKRQRERQTLIQSRRASERHQRDMQQYFTRGENLERMIGLACCQQWREREEVVIVEPSCGDGRVLSALVRHCASDERGREKRVRVKVIGCELDSSMAVIARERLRESLRECEGEDKCSGISGEVYMGDYLHTTRESLSLLPSLSSSSASVVCPCVRVIVIGNPPYSLIKRGTDAGNDEVVEEREVDLPLQFLLHSATDLQADKIVLLLPDRCGTQTFISAVRERLTEEQWKLEVNEIADSSFDLGERVIKQPTVIQVWNRL